MRLGEVSSPRARQASPLRGLAGFIACDSGVVVVVHSGLDGTWRHHASIFIAIVGARHASPAAAEGGVYCEVT
jgi:hypothetical protein